MLTSKHIKANGKVDLWDLGPKKDDPDYDKWMARHKGPVRIEQFAIDARHSLAVDPDRIVFKLPKGVQPGDAQREADERAERAAEEDQSQPDPYFGAAKP